ncbi:MAG TPA: ABC transporter permease, partial [Alphaproteobacteria bacterium]|nr:ABC transporter permease [Alphaproteobacteria bacterium]
MERLDTAGAWLVHRVGERFRKAGCAVEIAGVREGQRAMLEQVAAEAGLPPPREAEPNPLVAVVERLGEASVDA